METEAHRQRMILVAQLAWTRIQARAKEEALHDLGTHLGHEEASIDVIAGEEIEAAVRKDYPEFQGTIVFEDKEVVIGSDLMYLFVDQIDGTTNTKLLINSKIKRPIPAAISLALSTSRKLGDILGSAVLVLDSEQVFSAARADEGYVAFVDEIQMEKGDPTPPGVDSKRRLLVVGYSFKPKEYQAAVARALMAAGYRPYLDGCRSSSVDIVNIMAGLNRAYVDLRALFGDEGRYGAMLQGYDIAGVLPVALGQGLVVEAVGKSWQEHEAHERIALVVGRPEIMDRLMAAIEPWTDMIRVRTALPGLFV